MSTDKARDEYRAIRRRASSELKAEGFDAKVVEVLGGADKAKAATGERWVEAAKAVRIHCGRCAGTGQFVTMVVNGVPKGPGGPCYRCAGKGWQDDEDRQRNFNYDLYGWRVHIA